MCEETFESAKRLCELLIATDKFVGIVDTAGKPKQRLEPLAVETARRFRVQPLL